MAKTKIKKDAAYSKVTSFSSRIKGMGSKVKLFRFGKKKTIIIIVLLLIFGVWRYMAYINGGLEVTTSRVVKDNLTESISSSGDVMADKYAAMYFPTPGKVAWINVTEGQSVKKYQSLISLDKTLLDTAYQQAANTLRKYDATVDYVHDSLKNKDKTETFLEKDTRTTAEATKDSAYDAFRAAEYNLKNAVLYAPFDGIVTSFAAGMAVGANVTSATPAMLVIDPSTVYFLSQVGEIDVMKIKNKMKAEIALDAYPNETFVTEVLSIDFAPTTTSTGGTAYKVKISLPENKDMRFRLGMNGDAKFIISQKENVLMIPQNAIVEENDKTYVFIVEDGKAVKKEVKLGIYSIDDVEVLEGLNEGYMVIQRPGSKLKEGSRVKIK